MLRNLMAQIHNMPSREFYDSPSIEISSVGEAIFAVIIFGISGYLLWRCIRKSLDNDRENW